MSVKIDQSSLHTLPLSDSGGLVCISYAPGHNVHWIQALRSANHEEVAAQTWSGKVTGIDGEVVTVRKPDGSLARFRIHDPAQLVALLERRGVKVTVNYHFGITPVGIETNQGRASGLGTLVGVPAPPVFGQSAFDVDEDDREIAK
jgi:hypothetical protein